MAGEAEFRDGHGDEELERAAMASHRYWKATCTPAFWKEWGDAQEAYRIIWRKCIAAARDAMNGRSTD